MRPVHYRIGLRTEGVPPSWQEVQALRARVYVIFGRPGEHASRNHRNSKFIRPGAQTTRKGLTERWLQHGAAPLAEARRCRVLGRAWFAQIEAVVLRRKHVDQALREILACPVTQELGLVIVGWDLLVADGAPQHLGHDAGLVFQ